MILFAISEGGVGPVLSHIDLPLDANVLISTAASNQIIAHNGQYFPLADQGTDGLKSFYSNFPVSNETTAHNIHL